ncbi:putative RDD family membrane protein YckC [Maritalea mobilis]|uniref:Putative RDD family membrane protein YckC n=1 Tax=Maritalea mobilis TaxID=483324 RepID=A0A4R6VQA7_9HYPH|nr:RDD family protein [Maritalea mobilis]TDQ66132.1 putative RDD family membrane protein YckC [Maritalea mobilis]
MGKNSFGWFVRDDLPDPHSAPELFDGVLLRRILAFVIDLIVVTILIVIASVLLGILGVLTLGIAWLGYFILVPGVWIGYYALTLGTPVRATLGMQMMDIVLTPTRATPLEGWLAILHPIVGWVSITLFTPFILLAGLFTARRQLVHDLVVGTLMVRRSPMDRFWHSEYENYEAPWVDVGR